MIGKCDSCQFVHTEVSETQRTNPATGASDTVLLCEICANTHLSQPLLFPGQCSDPQLYVSLAWIANHLKQQMYKNSLKFQEPPK